MTSNRRDSAVCVDERTAIAWLAGDLMPEELARVDIHLDQCADCRAVLAEGARGLGGNKADRPIAPRGRLATTFGVGERLEKRYEIVRFIARGGMGEVYEAIDHELGQHVALKSVAATIADDPRAIQRLKSEVQLARQITHPNVCRMYDLAFHERAVAGRTEVIPFFTMELLEGETLGVRIRRQGRMSEDAALPMVEQMAGALAEAHRSGVIHRDFKSDNVMIVPARDGGAERLVVMDFGLARATLREGPTALTVGSGAFVGSVAYMAPEQVEGRPVTIACDVYALGVVLFEMVTGRLPFEANTPLAIAVKRLNEAAPRPRTLVPTVSARWEASILRCLARSERIRFPAVEDVVQALKAATDGFRWRIHLGRMGFWRSAAMALAALMSGESDRERVPVHPPAASGEAFLPTVFVAPPETVGAQKPPSWMASAMSVLRTQLGKSRNLRVGSEARGTMPPEASWTVKPTFTTIYARDGIEQIRDTRELRDVRDGGLEIKVVDGTGLTILTSRPNRADRSNPYGEYYRIAERLALRADGFLRRWRASTGTTSGRARAALLSYYGRGDDFRRHEPSVLKWFELSQAISLDHGYSVAHIEAALRLVDARWAGKVVSVASLSTHERMLQGASGHDALVAKCAMRAIVVEMAATPTDGDYRAAVELCTQAFQSAPAEKVAALALARLQRLSCDFDGAAKTLLAALETPAPRRLDLLVASAALSLVQGRPLDRTVTEAVGTKLMNANDLAEFFQSPVSLSQRLLLALGANLLRTGTLASAVDAQRTFLLALDARRSQFSSDSSFTISSVEEWVLVEGLTGALLGTQRKEGKLGAEDGARMDRPPGMIYTMATEPNDDTLELLSWVSPSATKRSLNRFLRPQTCSQEVRRSFVLRAIGAVGPGDSALTLCPSDQAWVRACKARLAVPIGTSDARTVPQRPD